MLLGDRLVKVDHLIQVIESSSKFNHNLVKSDILPKDKQNFESCEQISSDNVLAELASVPASRATSDLSRGMSPYEFPMVIEKLDKFLSRITAN